MKSLNIRSSLCMAVAVLAAAFSIPNLQATPYASCITNNAGTIQFYLNESNATAVVTYENGSTNASFNGITTGTNLSRGLQTFSLAGHTSYSIAVSKIGTGKASVVATMPAATPRGIDVNKNPTSPKFGYVYAVNASAATSNQAIRLLNSDLSGITTNAGGVAWANSASSPYRIAVAEDDYLMVGDFSTAHSGVWRVDPTITSNQLVLGPIGQSAGQAAGSQGAQFSRPLLIGNLQSGGSGVLYTVDAGTIPLNASQLNSILVYSNITLATLPRITAPDLLGPATCLNLVLNNNYPGITRGPNGYIYASGRRDGPSGGTANLQVYDANLNLLWNSLYNANVSDYFAVNGTGLADSAVSPDGKYMAGIGYGNNQIVVCSLTNGVPDVSTLYTVTNSVSQTSAGRGICWDAADNVYLSSSGGATFQEWTLGFTATAVTTGNATGTTGFSLVTPATTVGVVATNSIGYPSLSQQNSYGNPTNATFIITRTGNISSPLVVSFSLGGTASVGTYTASATTTITIAAGQTSTNVTITAVTDGISRPTTTIVLNLVPTGNYAVQLPGNASLDLINTGPVTLVAAAKVTSVYNVYSNDYASFTITRSGDTNAAAFTASLYTYGGTAVAGVDYTLPPAVTFNPGDVVQTNYIYPLSNGQLPVDSSTNVYVGNKTAIIGLSSGPGYLAATNKAFLNILDSAFPTTAVLFADPLTDPNDAVNWGVTAANNNMQTNAIDTAIAGSAVPNVAFGYDLQNGDTANFGVVPLPPSGATNALRVTVNKSSAQGSGAQAGVNLYPTNVSFSGNYAVRFNMNIVEGYNSAYTTEGAIFGINHSGNATNWWASSVLSGWGTPPSTSWESDGIWYWNCADNGAAAGAFQEFTGLGGVLPNTGWTQLASTTPASFANAFKTNVFTSSGGPGLPSNNSILNGNSAANWADVEIKQLNNIVTLSINKTTMFVYTNGTTFKSGTLMLGYDDPFSSVGAADAAVYYSNLRVVSLATPYISQIALNNLNGTVVINFTTVDGDTIASSFALQSASLVAGPYADVPGASITQLSAGAFQAVVPQSGVVQFYRIRQK